VEKGGNLSPTHGKREIKMQERNLRQKRKLSREKEKPETTLMELARIKRRKTRVCTKKNARSNSG